MNTMVRDLNRDELAFVSGGETEEIVVEGEELSDQNGGGGIGGFLIPGITAQLYTLF